MIQIPGAYSSAIWESHGADGLRWLGRLPSLVEQLCHQWQLRLDGPPMHGHLALVVPVRCGDEPCVLKISWLDEATIHEAQALALWNGRGTVRLFAAQPEFGAMLLERLDARRSLHAVPLEQAIELAGHLIHLLAIEAHATLPTLPELAGSISRSLHDRWQQVGRPMPKRFVDMAVDLAVQLPTSHDRQMVNWDLHYGNVLAGTRMPWLAIDPKAVVGAPELGLAQLLWTRLDEINKPAELQRHLHVLIETANLDSILARSWTLVRIIDYWLWALRIGLTEDPQRCETVLDWLGY